MNLRVLAVDLALRSAGWVVLESGEWRGSGTFLAGVGGSRGATLWALFLFLWRLVVSQKPTVLVIEVPRRWLRGKEKTSTETQEALAQAKGVALMVAEKQGVRLEEMDPGDAKETITRRRLSGKGEVRRCLELQGYSLEGVDEHQVDALCVGLAWWRCHEFAERVTNG